MRRGNSGRDPSAPEMEMERRALEMLVRMIWVAQCELGTHGRSATHPDAITRTNAMVIRLSLTQDSFAAEILSYLVKALIDLEGVGALTRKAFTRSQPRPMQ
jgi:hypothetical protein